MLKLLKFIFIFILIIIAAIGIFIFFKTVDLNKFKAQILTQASSALGTNVAMEDLSFQLSWENGFTLKGENISVDGHPDFSQEKFLKLKEVNLQLDVRALILNRQIVITHIVLTSPQINLVRNKNGEINAQKLIVKEEPKPSPALSHALIPPEETDPPADTQSAAPAPRTEEKSSAAALKPLPVPDIFIHSIVIEKGTVLWSDQMMEPPMQIALNDIDLKMTDFSFNKDLPVELDLSFLSSKDNVKAKGFLRIAKETGEIFLKNCEAKINLSTIFLEEVLKIFPQLAAAGIEGPMEGQITAKVSELTAGSQGLLKLASEINFKGGQLKIKQLASALEGISALITVSESDVNIENVNASLAAGTLTARGELKDYLKAQQFTFDAQMDGVLVERLIDQRTLPAQAKGKLKGNFNVEGTGFTLDAFKQSLKGTGHVEMADGKLINLNVLNLIVEALSIIPNAKEKIDQNLPQQYKDILESPNTILNKVTADMTLQGDTVVVKPVEVEAQGFLMQGSAEVNFEQNISAQAALVMAEDLSQAMVQAVPELSYMLDEEKQIYIPFTPYQGPVSGFKMRPDMAYIGEHAVKSVIEEQIEQNVPEELQAPVKEILGTLEDLLKNF